MKAAAVALKVPEIVDQPASDRVGRFTLADFRDMGEWLLWRLKDRFPQTEQTGLYSWIRGQMEGNDKLFIRLNRAVALAGIVHRPLDPRPIVEEVFVLVKGRDADGALEKGGIEEGARLYGEIKRWAENMDAIEFRDIERHSDVPREMIKAALGGRLQIRESIYMKVGK